MPDLPRVEQSFTADVSDYVAKMQLMIDETERFAEEIDEAIGKIGEFKAALASLPDEVDIKVTLDTAGLAEQIEEIKTEVDALGKATIPITLDEDEIMEQVVYIREILSDIPPVKIPVELDGIPEVLTQIAAVKAALDDLNLDDFKTTVAAAATAMTAAGAAGAKAETGIKDAGTAAADTTWAWLSLTHGIQTFGGALTMAFGKDIPLITSIAGWHLLLDGVAESVIALSGAFIALGSAAAGLAPSFLDIYNHLVATRDLIEAFGVEVKPFNEWFLNLQHAMQTQAIELYGEALLDLGKANGTLMTSIENVGQAIDRMGAKISEWVGTNTNFANTISKGAEYAKDLGDILGNLIVIIDELIRADSGIVNFVLDFFNGFTKAIAAVLGFSEALDRLLLLTHGLLLWGGLLSSMLINIALLFLRPVANIASFVAGISSADTALGNLAEDATPIQKMGAVFTDIAVAVVSSGLKIQGWASSVGEDMAEADGIFAKAGAGITGVLDGMGAATEALLSQSWLPWVAGIAAVVGAYEGFQKLGASARAAAAAVTSAVDSMTASGAIDNISSTIGNLNTKIAQVPGVASDAKNAIGGLAEGYENAGDPVSALAGYTAHFILGLVNGQKSISAYQSAISNLTSQQKTLFQVAGDTMQQNGVTFVQALGLMDAAGVKAGESFSEDMTQVTGLIRGYENLGVQGNLLGNSINAITLSTEQQETEISKVTQGWTNFITLITGGESSLVTVAQQVQGTMAAAGGAASSLSISNGKVTDSIKDASAASKGAAVDIDSLSTAGLALKSSFIQSVQSMNSSLNSLMELSSAAGEGQQGLDKITQAGKDYVASLLPVAKGSQDATAMLYALAQQAGYTGADSFKSLAEWVGNVKNPMQQAENIMNSMTVAAGNLAKDVTNLANAIDTDLNSAMAEAVLNAGGTQKAFDNMAAAIKSSHGDISDMIPAAQQLATTLLTDLGGNTAEAKNEFVTFMEAMGQTKTEADTLWASVNKLATAINGLHSKTITITANEITTGSLASAGIDSSALPKVGAASGWLVPGSGSGDSVPAMLTPGEAVVPKHLVGAVAPFLAANRVPGFASGGMAAPMLPPAPDLTGLAQLLAQLSADTSWADWNAAQPSGKITGPQTAGQNAAEGFRMAAWAQTQLSGLQAMQAGGSTAGLASLLLPGTPLSTLAAGIPGIGIGAGALTSSSVSASTGADQVLHSHVSVNLDGQQIWSAIQKQGLKYGIRNNGVATGLMKPK